MKLKTLLNYLEGFRDEYGEDIEVQLMIQPSYPVTLGIYKATCSDELPDMDAKPPVVFLLEGTRTGYGSKKAWDQ